MSSSLLALPLAVGLPLFAALFTGLTRGKIRSLASILFAFALLVLAIYLASTLLGFDFTAQQRYAIAGWAAPLGIDLIIDGFSAIMLLVTALLVFVLSAYSCFYFHSPNTLARFWPLWWLLVAGLNAAFLSSDAFNIYVCLEMIGLASVALVALGGSRDALVAALRYALVGLLGSLFYLLGVALLYRSYGTLDLTQLAAVVKAEPNAWAALSLISAGLLLKTALFPLHFWLAPAHSSAPAPVSAALSALVVKASFYLLARYWLDVLEPATTPFGLQVLGVLGGFAIVWGCIAAYQSKRLKLLVAYSTVAQLGYLFLLFPISASLESKSLALQAAVFFIVAHALAKAAMFVAAGNILKTLGHDNIAQLHGLAHTQSLNILTFAIAGASLIGLPPSGGFIAKWLLLNSAIVGGQWIWVVVMLGGGLLAAAYIFKVLNIAFSDEQPRGEDHIEKGVDELHHRNSSYSKTQACFGLVLAVLAICLGLNTEWFLKLVSLTPLSSVGALWNP